ncbi:hypothetical protein BD408DRAFT_410075, partial [Parasitella parasitica]
KRKIITTTKKQSIVFINPTLFLHLLLQLFVLLLKECNKDRTLLKKAILKFNVIAEAKEHHEGFLSSRKQTHTYLGHDFLE